VIKRVEHTGSFTAVGDDGSPVMVDIFTEIVDVGTFGNPDAEMEGLKRLLTADGHHVNRLDKGKYQVVNTGQHLSSTDPNAP
jgi:hypothetical protein